MQTVELLLVEDNPGDVQLVRKALERAGLAARLSVVADGAAALDFLQRKGLHAAAPRPDLVLLDLDLPRRSGHEVLDAIKRDPELCRTPVIVLTSSEAERDVLRSYELHANSFVTKPVGLPQLARLLAAIWDYWFRVVKLPQRD